jgi:hypothetical protein
MTNFWCNFFSIINTSQHTKINKKNALYSSNLLVLLPLCLASSCLPQNPMPTSRQLYIEKNTLELIIISVKRHLWQFHHINGGSRRNNTRAERKRLSLLVALQGCNNKGIVAYLHFIRNWLPSKVLFFNTGY